ncbi:MAG TPA: recombinase family protein [Solirubrobacteraceae bacterium]
MAFDGYIRVSRVAGREGESFQSPDVQREAIEGFAKAKGLDVRINESELDVTGSKLKRPILNSILARIKAGKSDGIMVATVDRLSRAGLGDAIKLVEGIIDAGGKVSFVELDIDPSTKEGEFMLNTWLGMAHMLWRGYQEKWETSRTNAVKRGVLVGPTPIGFVKTGKGARLELGSDVDQVREFFDVSGADGLEAALAFGRRTWPTRVNTKGEVVDRHWSATVARRMLANRVYLGEIRSGDIVEHFEDLRIVNQIAFDFAQHPTNGRVVNGDYPLSGIARCAACGGPLVGHLGGRVGKKKRSYRCTGRGCTERPHVDADKLDWLALDAARTAPHKAMSGDEVFQFSKAIMLASAEVDAWVKEVSIGDIGAAMWKEGLEARQAALAARQSEFDAARETRGSLPDLEDPTPEDMRQAFKLVFRALKVERGRGALDDRVALELTA